MIKFFRNPEIIETVVLQLIISVAAAVFTYFIEIRAVYFTAVICITFILIYIISTYKRYKRLSDLSSDIDKILHGSKEISFTQYQEGELCILASEVSKMTLRLKEQQDNLLKDKINLADSIANISHQIRTPLTSINLLLQFISNVDISQEKRQEYIKELSLLLTIIDWLINSLLKMSKIDAGTVKFKQESILLEELIEKSAYPLLIPIELRGQTFKISADGSFKGDILWTSEAIGNIIKNCMEHTENGGIIEVNATQNPLYSEIVIKDNGCGIDKKDLPHIFDRFYKGKNSDDKSFGIGLALARTIISSQNGTVKADNSPLGGAVFTIRFYNGTV